MKSEAVKLCIIYKEIFKKKKSKVVLIQHDVYTDELKLSRRWFSTYYLK